jgi:hypothetical protein
LKNLGPFLQKTMLEHATIDERDAHFARMTNDPQEALDIIRVQCSSAQI